ncbi:Sir2 family NAD-dependent protein deacetylase [Actinophytocola sp.]|uniref:SIR2 family NAD-dependent protein deacylase n=1 Tax=Actinophytocola sp. TaxID=1872138 RepID=UPI002D327C51|nr:Sir2 family NAD-dependent protein deacetylase [Actinophytocola sp.]HYQ65898.1 Sir2 family NAD-dependent protein deacetylase [Actinophytocola sp.]
MAEAKRIVVLSGAGVSTESGIPDFRGPNGLWTRDPSAERMSSFADYRDDPEVRRRSWRSRLAHPAWTAAPNAAHQALVSLERSGRLVALVTQNIDGLHQRAGSASVLELHGTMHETVCLTCADRRPMRAALDRVAAGEEDPPCEVCGGILKSATISFGQPLDTDVLMAARDAVLSCDLMLAVGSSLSVQPAAGLVGLAAQAGATVLICNASETPYDGLATVVLRGSLGEVLPALVS